MILNISLRDALGELLFSDKRRPQEMSSDKQNNSSTGILVTPPEGLV